MTQKKFLIFDAGPLISLTMNGLLPIIEKLKKEFNGEFIITPQVKKEVIDRPLKIKKYKLEAIKIENLLEKGILTLSSKFISNLELNKQTKKIMKIANSCLIASEKIKIVHEGEASCLAFAKICNCKNMIVIDERTTRMITEAPENIRNLLERKLHTKINLNRENLEHFKNFKFIRSSELLFIAYKKNLIDLKKDKNLLDALLYGVKFSGTTISSREIEDMKKLI